MKVSFLVRIAVCGWLVILLSGCNDVTTFVEKVVHTPTPVPTHTPAPTQTPPPTATLTPTPTPTPLPTPMALVVSLLAQDDINLRQEPDATSAVVGQLPPGVFVPIHAISDDGVWLQVGIDTIGWVDAKLVTLSGYIEITESSAQERQPLLQADSPVNVRSGPGLKFRVIGRLKAGQIIDVLETSEDANWVRVPFGNGDGWVNVGTVIIAGGMPTATPVVTEEVTREP